MSARKRGAAAGAKAAGYTPATPQEGFKGVARSPQKKGPGKGPGGPAGKMMPGEKANDFKGTMKTLLGYLAPYKIRLGLVFLFAIASTVFTILAPDILGDATDTIVTGLYSGTGVDYDALKNIVLLLVGLYALSFVFSFTQGFIMARVSQSVTYGFRQELSEKIDTLPMRFFDGMTHGEYQSRVINDIESINQSLNQSLTQVISAAVTLVGILVMMLRISPLMTLVAVCVLPLSMLLIKVVVGKSQGHFKNQQKYLGYVNSHVEEMYTGHNVVKAFNKEASSEAIFDEYNSKLYESAWKSQFLSGTMMPLTGLVGNLGYVAICILGGHLALGGAVSIGDIQAFITYVKQFNQPLQMVANAANMLQSTAAAAERVFEVLSTPEEPDAFHVEEEKAKEKDAQALAKAEGHVSFQHVKFGYKEGETIIHDFTFTAEAGSRVAIVGPTGAGKTTIVKLLMRYYELDGGQILVDHKDITTYSRRDLRDRFGMVLQDTWLFSGTIRENLKYGRPEATDEEMMQAAKAAHIHHYIMTQPEGYDTKIHEGADNISQGQKQLLTIARAMLADNPILILDEATSSVDTRTERLIQEAMARLMQGRTSFVIAHRLSTIKDADTILVLQNGDVVEQGTHQDLLQQNGAYAKLYNSQFEQ